MLLGMEHREALALLEACLLTAEAGGMSRGLSRCLEKVHLIGVGGDVPITAALSDGHNLPRQGAEPYSDGFRRCSRG